MTEKWTVTFKLSRQKQGGKRHFDRHEMEVDPDEYVLDGVERVWAHHDRSLTFRHACHHSTCGACGMLVNGVEKLTCITTIRSVTKNGGTIKVEPLRNFPVVSDLVVDMSDFYLRVDASGFSQVSPVKDSYTDLEKTPASAQEFERLVDCIECGMCISACPAAYTSESYVGPAVLAGIQHAHVEHADFHLLDLADSAEGVWRCHSAYECSAVCPSNVDPAWRIMNLRGRVVGRRIRKLFSKKESVK